MKSGWVFPPESWIFLKLACSVHTPCPLRKLGPRARRSLSLSSASWLPKQHPSLLSPTFTHTGSYIFDSSNQLLKEKICQFCLSSIWRSWSQGQDYTCKLCSKWNTVGPQITSLYPVLFHYNVDKEKSQFPAGATVCVKFSHSPHICVAFLQVLWFLPTSKGCARQVNWRVYLSQSE